MGYSWPLLAYVWLEIHVKRIRDRQEHALLHALTSVLPPALQSVVYQPLQHHHHHHQAHQEHQDHSEPQPHHHHHHHHHHAQLSVSPSVSQHAQLPVAHRRSIRNRTIDSILLLETAHPFVAD